MKNTLACIIVTYNRISCLKKALMAYENQTIQPDLLIVIDNHSTDGTLEFLNQWQQEQQVFTKKVIRLDHNIGGSGGFYTGCQEAIRQNVDWVWLADDDAYPHGDAIAKTKAAFNSELVTSNVAAICSTVLNEGVPALIHRRRFHTGCTQLIEEPVPLEEYRKKCFSLSFFTYVGAIIRVSTLKQVGLCDKNFFIYYDDTEHSYRISQIGKILCIPDILIDHDLKLPVHDFEDVRDWRFYYATRNYYVFLKRHFPTVFWYQWSRKYFRAKCHLAIGRKVSKYTIEMAALQDAYHERLGLHKLYRPGWK